jgi:CheY-like chemotaxis protein
VGWPNRNSLKEDAASSGNATAESWICAEGVLDATREMPRKMRTHRMAETLILSVDLDPLLLYARESVLRSEGYITVSATSVKEAFQRFREGDFDLMILGNTLPAKDRERLTCLIRASGSRMPIASISSTPRESSVFPDATIQENPVDLVAGTRRLLAKRLRLASLGSSSRPRGDLLALTVPAPSRVSA